MYRQSLVDEQDRDFQRILWYKDGQIVEYTLNTVTYGTNYAPYLAIRCLMQLAEDGLTTHPLAAAALKNNSYVDDILTGGDTIESALQIRNELIDLLRSAGMELDKWSANADKLLPVGATATGSKSFTDISKTLGLVWNQTSDHFTFPTYT